MEKYTRSDADDGLPILELPDATKLVRITEDKAIEVADIALPPKRFGIRIRVS